MSAKANAAGAASVLATMDRARSVLVKGGVLENKSRPKHWGCSGCGQKLGNVDTCDFCGFNVLRRRDAALYHLTHETRCGCELCERAAIVEFEAKFSRGEAVTRAIDELFPPTMVDAAAHLRVEKLCACRVCRRVSELTQNGKPRPIAIGQTLVELFRESKP